MIVRANVIIENSISSVKIYELEGDDSIVNDFVYEFEYDENGHTIGDGKPIGAKNVTISAGAGNDTRRAATITIP